MAEIDMVERAARAVCESNSDNPSHWRNYRKAARAALEAAFKVTDEDARAFFDDEFAKLWWVIEPKDSGAPGMEARMFDKAMQALSDAALRTEALALDRILFDECRIYLEMARIQGRVAADEMIITIPRDKWIQLMAKYVEYYEHSGGELPEREGEAG